MHAKKSLWQNFLINQGIIKKIVNSYPIQWKNVVEVGPGQWAITQAIIDLWPKSLSLIELDDRLIMKLRDGFWTFASIYHGDVLRSYISSADQSIEIQFDTYKSSNAEDKKEQKENYIVFWNIPYYITSPIISHFLHEDMDHPNAMVLMMQKEVANKILRTDGKHSVLSLGCELACKKITKVTDVSPGSFKPPPKVHSTVLLFELHDHISTHENKQTLKLIHAWFHQKRKKLIKNLQTKYSHISKEGWEKIFLSVRLPIWVRAEVVDVGTWKSILKHMNAH